MDVPQNLLLATSCYAFDLYTYIYLGDPFEEYILDFALSDSALYITSLISNRMSVQMKANIFFAYVASPSPFANFRMHICSIQTKMRLHCP